MLEDSKRELISKSYFTVFGKYVFGQRFFKGDNELTLTASTGKSSTGKSSHTTIVRLAKKVLSGRSLERHIDNLVAMST